MTPARGNMDTAGTMFPATSEDSSMASIYRLRNGVVVPNRVNEYGMKLEAA